MNEFTEFTILLFVYAESKEAVNDFALDVMTTMPSTDAVRIDGWEVTTP